jgi:hypothetical protein
MRKTHCCIQFWAQFLSQKNNHGKFLKMIINLTPFMQIVRNQENWAFYKRTKWANGKNQRKNYILPRKAQGETPT